jgi:chemotaxis protein methyltransferase CheR
LHRSLVADGWLFPSGTEASREVFGAFHSADAPGTIVYRKSAPSAPQYAWQMPEFTAPSTTAAPWIDFEYPLPDTRGPLPASEPPIALTVNSPVAPTKLARDLANEGRLSEALATCDRALLADKVSPTGYYLRGLILEEQGAYDEAAKALRRALYLDCDFIVAHFALGNLMRRRARKQDAERCFKNARMLLRNCEPAAELPESDGLTAGRLLTILEANQESHP